MKTLLADRFKTFLGGIVVIGYLIFLTCCNLLMMFRLFVIFLAKCTRPDLGDILNGMSSFFAIDYFSGLPPRNSIISTKVFCGHVTLQEVQKTVQDRWINNKSEEPFSYTKFQQYPVRWMGFTFWKRDPHPFSIDRHIHLLSGRNVEMTDDQLNESVEKILNSSYAREQSPWEFFVVENYKASNLDPADGEKLGKSVVILKLHHCLADAFSMRQALAHLNPSITFSNFQHSSIRQHKPQTWREVLQNSITFCVVGFLDVSYYMSQHFRSSPWKVPDKRKQRYQIYDRTESIPVSTIKEIKNEFGVTFTSVMLSAISAAVSQSYLDVARETRFEDKVRGNHVQYFSVPPRNQSRRNCLTNEATAAILTLPTGDSESPSARLKSVNERLEKTKFSTSPIIAYCFMEFAGRLCFPLNKLVSLKTEIVLTNFPGTNFKAEFFGKRCLDIRAFCGGLDGEAGIMIAVVSYDQHITVEACAERALFSRKQLRLFMSYITVEIHNLRKERRSEISIE